LIPKIKTCLMATRSASLIMTAIPVVMGTALAMADGIAHLPTALIALFGGIMIHAGANLTNDYYDMLRGTDQIGDLDPMRGHAVGTVSTRAIGWGAVVAFLLLIPAAVYLIDRAGWPILTIAVLSVLAGIFYTAGNMPLAYLGGYGDLFVLIFFGPVALAGTYFVQSLEINAAVCLAGLGPGLFAVCVLTVNNIRDYENDKRQDKNTLVVRFGRRFGVYEFLSAMIAVACVPVLIFVLIQDHIGILFAGLILFPAIPLIHTVLTCNDQQRFNQAIGNIIQLLLVYGLVFSVGWLT